VYLKEAIGQREAGDFPSAIENYQKACKINHYNVVAWYKLAYAYGRTGQYDKALNVYLNINNHLFPDLRKQTQISAEYI